MTDIILAHKLMAGVMSGIPLMAWSPAGMGKTHTVKAVSRILNRDLLTIIGALREPTDITGAMFVDEGDIKISKPWIFRELENMKNPMIFWDEFSTTPRATQNAQLRLIHEGAIDKWVLPENTYQVAASNFIDTAGNTLLSPAMANRFLHVLHEPTPKEWINSRARDIDVSFKYDPNWKEHIPEYDAVIMDLVEKMPEYFHKIPESFEKPMDYAFPTPRSHEAAAKMLALTVNDPDMSRVMVSAAVGTEFSGKIHNYLRTRDKSLSFLNIDLNNFRFPDDPSQISQLIKAAALYAKQPEHAPKAIKLFNMAYESGSKPCAMQYAILLAKNIHEHQKDPTKITSALPFVGKILTAGR
jgi:hypothetical protein